MTHSSKPTVASLREVNFSYRSDMPVLEDASLEVKEGDFLGVIGPNGSGKTTVLKLLLGLVQPQSGEVSVFGRKPAKARHDIGYVPQYTALDAAVPATALDVVLLGRLRHSPWGATFGRRHLDAAHAALERVAASSLADQQIHSLSGGQRQRVLIARALACHAKLLLLDEPTTGVDFHAERGLMELLQKLNESLPIVMVSHDLALVSACLNRVACVGRSISIHHASAVTAENLQQLYGRSIALVDHQHDHGLEAQEGSSPSASTKAPTSRKP